MSRTQKNTPWKKHHTAHPARAWALEARLMFDAAAVAEAVHDLAQAQDTHHQDLQRATAEAQGHVLHGLLSHEAQTALRQALDVAPLRPLVRQFGGERQLAGNVAVQAEDAPSLRPVDSATPAAGHEILFIDSDVDASSLVAGGVRAGTEIIRLSADLDPWQQMSAAIAARDGISAIHLVSHGDSGELLLAGRAYSAADLAARSAQIESWRSHLTADADLLLYGCDIGTGSAGAALIDTLARETRADVAASTDLTGAASLGGNWIFEVSTGQIDTTLVFDQPLNFASVLAPVGGGTLAAPSVSLTWHDVMVGTQYDPANDQQANSKQDLVGDATYAMLQATQDATNAANPTYFFRARFGDAAVTGTSFYLALDTSGDQLADVFVEAKVAANGSTLLAYHAVDPSAAGTGPSNTGWLSSPSDTSQELTASTSASYVAVSSAGTDLDANSSTDSWVTFGFTLNSLKTFGPAASVTGSTGMVLYAFTSTSQTANGDIAGVNDQTDDLSLTWTQLGLGVSTSLNAVTTTDFGTPTVSISNVTVSEASPYAVFQVSLDKPGASAISFTPQVSSGSATAGTDLGTAVQYYNGSAWVSASGGVSLSGGATSVLLRVAVNNDAAPEGSETFSLGTGGISGTVMNAAGVTGTGTIVDDGSSSAVFLDANTTATPTVGTADHDLPNSAPTAAADSFSTAEDTARTSQLPAASDSDGDTVTYAKADDPSHGSVTVNANGSYTYTPTANYNGSDSFSYTVSDGQGGSNSYTVSITVNAVNDAPTAAATSISTAEDTAYAGNLPTATDVDGNSVSYAKASDPSHGSVTLNANGSYTYTPTANYNGSDSFSYTVSDGQGGSNSYTVSITVGTVNDAPTAAGTSISVTEDTPYDDNLPTATDVDGDSVSYAKASDPSHGTVTVNSDGSYRYVPAQHYQGSDSFSYTVSDGQGGSNTYSVSVSVSSAANRAPVGAADAVSTDEDTALTAQLPTATDADGDSLSYAMASDASHGSVTINSDGSYTYTPVADWSGSDSFSYTVSDGQGGSNSYTVSVTVHPEDDAPTSSDLGVTIDEDSLLVSALPSASDVEGDTLVYAKASDPLHGSASVDANGDFSYTPDADFVGSDSFSFSVGDGNGGTVTQTVHITVEAVNDHPTLQDGGQDLNNTVSYTQDGPAVALGSALVGADTELAARAGGTGDYGGASLTLERNGGASAEDVFSAEGSTLSFGPDSDALLVNGHRVGSVSQNAGQLVLDFEAGCSQAEFDAVLAGLHYEHVGLQPPASVELLWTLDDGNPGDATDPASQGLGGSHFVQGLTTVTITAVNHAPVAADQSESVAKNAVLDASVPVATDVDSLVEIQETGAVDYTVSGRTFSFYSNSDGSEEFQVSIGSPAGGFASIDDMVAEFQAHPNYASLPYTIAVNGAGDGLRLTFKQAGNYDTRALERWGDYGTPLTTLREGQSLSYALDTDVPAGEGSLSFDADGSYSFTPGSSYNDLAPGESRSTQFTYTAIDPEGTQSAPRTVTLTVTGSNDAPLVHLGQGTSVTGSLTELDATQGSTTVDSTSGQLDFSDIDLSDSHSASAQLQGAVWSGGGSLDASRMASLAAGFSLGTISDSTGSGQGSLAWSYAVADGELDFLHSGETVTLTFTVTLSDSHGEGTSQDITLTLNGRNDAPASADLSVNVDEDATFSSVLPGTSDAEGDTLVYAKASDPAHGTLSVDANGNFDYTPDAGYVGSDSFSFSVDDGEGGSDIRTVSITVDPVNDYPTLQDGGQDLNNQVNFTQDGPPVALGSQLSAVDAELAALGSRGSYFGVVLTLERNGGASPEDQFSTSGRLSFDANDLLLGGEFIGAVVNDGGTLRLEFNQDTTQAKLNEVINSLRYANVAGAPPDSVELLWTLDDGNTDGQQGSGGAHFVQGLTTVTITAVNHAPVGADLSLSGNEDDSFSGQLPTATDQDGDDLSYGIDRAPLHGTAQVDADGSYHYQPDADFDGQDSFTYRVYDPYGGERLYTVTIDLAPVNDAPVAADITLTLDQDSSASGSLPAASDAEGDAITYQLDTSAAHGTVSVDDQGNYSYTPAAGFTGVDGFDYRVNDGQGGSSVHHVTLEVGPVNHAPSAAADQQVTVQGRPLDAQLPTATDPDGNTPLSYQVGQGPAHGQLVLQTNGVYRYTPDLGYAGGDSFSYTVSDGQGGQSISYQVDITIDPVVSAPVVSGEVTLAAINEDSGPRVITQAELLALASDPDTPTAQLQTLRLEIASGQGQISHNADGSWTYTPALNDDSQVSFRYVVSDDSTEVAGTARMDILPVNDAPTAAATSISTAEDIAKSGQLPVASDVEGDGISYAKVTDPTHGSVTVNANGSYTYTPAANYNGSDSFTYSVSDGNGGSTTYTVSVTVNAINDVPTAADASISTDEDTAKSGQLPTASDIDGDTPVYAKASDPAHGSVTVNANGSYTYTPTANYNGMDSFTYSVSDGNGGSTTYTVNVTVNAVNDAPAAANASISTEEDTAKSGQLPAASDVDGDTPVYAKASDPAHGTATVNANGTYTYTPAANYNGSDSFTYSVSDGQGGSTTYTVNVTVNAVNDAPAAANASISTDEDTAKSGQLPTASDIDGDTPVYAKASDPTHGTATVNANGTYTYTPTANYNGMDSFTYSVSDGNGGSTTYTVNVTVNAVNDAPTAANASISTDEDTAKSGQLPVASDVEGHDISYAKVTDPTHGSVTINANGSYTYTPAANYNGSDSFTYSVSDGQGGSTTYTVNVTVNAANDAPTAANASISTDEDTAKSGQLPTASDVDGDIPGYAKASDPAHGTVTVNANGSYTYTPTANYNGSDSFTYSVSDGNGGSTTYTVSVTVNAANDAPTAANASISTDEDTAKAGQLPSASDIDGDMPVYAKASDPTHGTATVDANGSYTYTPTANYNGTDSFTYSVSDGNGGSTTYTVSVTVNAANDAPTAANASISTDEDTAKSGQLPTASDIDGDTPVYAKASDPAHGSVTVNANGTYTYTPSANYNGSDSFTYSVSDGNGDLSTYTVSVTVNAGNDAPTAANASISTDEDTAKSGQLPTASDIDGDTPVYAKASDPAHGTVTVNANGTYTYTPSANYNGSDSFTYSVSDGNGGLSTYTVSVTVNAGNDAPTAANTSISTDEDTAKSGQLPTASDIDGDTPVYAKASDPAHGSVTVNANGTYTYTPTANFHGSDSFTYSVSDGNGGSNTYTLNVTVNAANDAPTAANATISTDEDTAKSGQLPSASDIDGDTPVYAKVADPTHGTVTVNANGSYTYTPAANYNGSDSFTYSVSDGQGGSTTYTVSVTVNAANDAPAAANASISTDEDTAKSGQLPTASDIDGDTPVYAKASDPAHGTVTVNANGTYTYTPAANYNGSDSFTYSVSDGQGGSSTYTVSVTVNATNDAPTAANTSISTDEDTAKSGQLPTASDVDGDPPVYSKASDPAHGTVTVNANGSYTYTPTANYNGSDSFTYSVSDGQGGSSTYTVNVTVNGANDAPTAANASISTDEDTAKSGQLPTASDIDGDTPVYAKASDPTHGTVTVNANGSYTYTPAANYNGTDSFTYSVSDGQGGLSTYTVNVTVNAVNDAPTWADPAPGLTAADTPVQGQLPVPADVDGDRLVVALDGQAAHGTASIDADGRWTYTPAAGWSGTDHFTVSVDDGQGGRVLRVVEVAVLPTPSIALPAAWDLGPSATDRVTSAPEIALAGEASAGATLRIYGPQGQLLGEVQAGTDGRWQLAGIDMTHLMGDRSGAIAGGRGAYSFSVAQLLPDGREGAPGRLTITREIVLPVAQEVAKDSGDAGRSGSNTGADEGSGNRSASGSGTTAGDGVSEALRAPQDNHEASGESRPAGARSSADGDIYTRPSGFQIMVAPATEPALKLFRGVEDQLLPQSKLIVVQVPADAFVHTVVTETVTLSATQADGTPLPAWLSFDGRSGKLIGEPPQGQAQDLAIKVSARDSAGREVSTMFRLQVSQGALDGGEQPAQDATRPASPTSRLSPAQRNGLASPRTAFTRQLARGEALALDRPAAKPGQAGQGGDGTAQRSWQPQSRDLASLVRDSGKGGPKRG